MKPIRLRLVAAFAGAASIAAVCWVHAGPAHPARAVVANGIRVQKPDSSSGIRGEEAKLDHLMGECRFTNGLISATLRYGAIVDASLGLPPTRVKPDPSTWYPPKVAGGLGVYFDQTWYGWWTTDFMNVYVNGVGFWECRPRLEVVETPGLDAVLKVTWENDEATVITSYALEAGDDKLLCEVEVQPKKEVRDWEIVLLCYPSSLKGEKKRVFITPKRRTEDAAFTFDPQEEPWMVYADENLDPAKVPSCGPVAAMWAPGEGLKEGRIEMRNNYDVLTTLACQPAARKVHLAFWAFYQKPNEQAEGYFRRSGQEFLRQIQMRVSRGWYAGQKDPVTLPSFKPAPYVFSDADRRRGYVVFSRPLFSAINYGTVPRPEDAVADLSALACPGEYEPVTLAVHAAEDLADVHLRGSALKPVKGNGKAIGADALDVRVVCCPDGLVPGPLLRRCETELAEWKTDDPVQDYAQTERIASNSTRQFWVTVHVPADAKPGDYAGGLELQMKGKGPLVIPLKLSVLPVALLEPPKRRLTYFLQHTDTNWGNAFNPCLPEVQFRLYVKDTAEHGMTGLMMWGHRAEAFQRMVAVAVEEGMGGPFVQVEGSRSAAEMAPLHAALKKMGVECWSYTDDEPGHKGQVPRVLKHLDGLLEAGSPVKVITAINCDIGLNDMLARTNFVPNYAVDWFGEWPAYLAKAKERDRPVYFYWQCYERSFVRNRHYAGYFLWQSGFDGFAPFAYLGTAPGAHFLTVYPSVRGPLSTLDWEALREGLDDYRYVWTLEQALKTAKGKEAESARAVLDAVRKEFDGQNCYGSLGPAAYVDARRRIAAALVSLVGK